MGIGRKVGVRFRSSSSSSVGSSSSRSGSSGRSGGGGGLGRHTFLVGLAGIVAVGNLPGRVDLLQAGRQPVCLLGVDGHLRRDWRGRGEGLQDVGAVAPHHFRRQRAQAV